MALFKDKRRESITAVNELALQSPTEFVKDCENQYKERLAAAADEILRHEATVVLASGPSASGKTTSANLLAREIKNLGADAIVISLDDFFKGVDKYPKTADGKPDLEHVETLDIPLVKSAISELLATGHSTIPQYDFVTQRRKTETREITLAPGAVAIIEGIHALNPILTEDIDNMGRLLKMYIGLREEYYSGLLRELSTRDLRITRRLVRDRLSRGYSIEHTLSVWENIKRGENKWIKPFKRYADMLLDTSITCEPCIFRYVMDEIVKDDENQGGIYRDTFAELRSRYEMFTPLSPDLLAADSMLREFVGGLQI